MDLLEGSHIERPTSRGKFSFDRTTWEKIHEHRFLQWQLGEKIETIAEQEGVTYNAIKHSILVCESRLSQAEVVASRNARLRLLTFDKLHEKFTKTMEELMSDPNPIVRLKAIESFRKTMASEQTSPVLVTTQVNVGSAKENTFDFEATVAKIREKQRAAYPEEFTNLEVPETDTPY